MDNRNVQQNVLNDNRYVGINQRTVNLQQGTGASSSSGGGGGGGTGGGGGGGRPKPRKALEFDMTIDDDEPRQEKRASAIAAIDARKKKKTNPPAPPIALPDRKAKRKADIPAQPIGVPDHKAKRRVEIPDGAPDADEDVKRAGAEILKRLRSKLQSNNKKKAMSKLRHATPYIVDMGEPPLPPPAVGPSRNAFKGKGRRLADDDPAPKGIIKLYDKKPTVKSKPGGASGRARSRASMLALTA